MMDPKLFDSLLEPVFLINSEGIILYCNETASNISGLSQRKIIRQKMRLNDLFHFEEEVSFLQDLHTVTSPTPYQEVGFKNMNGDIGKVQLTIQPFDQNSQWILYFRDVTLEETLQKKYRAELDKKEAVILELQAAQRELQNYSKNLEKMVQERTEKIREMNRLLKALLDSLGQGFFIINEEGKCLDIASQACIHTVERMPQGLFFWEIFKMNPQQVDGLRKWLKTIFSEMLPFEDLAPLGPQRFPHRDGKFIQIQYYPLLSDEQRTEGVVVVATDNTELRKALFEAERDKAQVEMILKLIKYKREALKFIREVKEILNSIGVLLHSNYPKNEIQSLLRLFHTLKGGAASYSIQKVKDLSHEIETLLSAMDKSSDEKLLSVIKYFFLQIQTEMDIFLEQSQLVLGPAALSEERWVEAPLHTFLNFREKIQSNERALQQFDQIFLEVPISSFMLGQNEWIQDLARSLNKEVIPLEVLDLDSIHVFPEHYDKLFQTFVHAFRNSLDHGIETMEERVQSGKLPQGKLRVQFQWMDSPQKISNEILRSVQNQKWIQILIQDDGRGISTSVLKEKLEARGIRTEGMSAFEIIQTVFHPGFSTQEVISEISGRGIGMDAILFEARKLGGQAFVQSEEGHGFSLFVQVPYIATSVK